MKLAAAVTVLVAGVFQAVQDTATGIAVVASGLLAAGWIVRRASQFVRQAAQVHTVLLGDENHPGLRAWQRGVDEWRDRVDERLDSGGETMSTLQTAVDDAATKAADAADTAARFADVVGDEDRMRVIEVMEGRRPPPPVDLPPLTAGGA